MNREQKMTEKKAFRGYLMVVGAATAWGLNGTLAKFLFIGGEVGPLFLTAVRATLAFPILAFPLLLWERRLLKIHLRDLPLLALVGIGVALANFTYFYTISLTTVATAILLQYTAPILVAIFGAAFLKERLTPIVLAALALAVSGCFLMVKAYDPAVLRLNLPGLLSGLLSAFSFASYTLEQKSLRAPRFLDPHHVRLCRRLAVLVDDGPALEYRWAGLHHPPLDLLFRHRRLRHRPAVCPLRQGPHISAGNQGEHRQHPGDGDSRICTIFAGTAL